MRRALAVPAAVAAIALAGCGSGEPADAAPTTTTAISSASPEPADPDREAVRAIYEEYGQRLIDADQKCPISATNLFQCGQDLMLLDFAMDDATGAVAQQVESAERKYPDLFEAYDAAQDALGQWDSETCALITDRNAEGVRGQLCMVTSQTAVLSASSVGLALRNIAEGS